MNMHPWKYIFHRVYGVAALQITLFAAALLGYRTGGFTLILILLGISALFGVVTALLKMRETLPEKSLIRLGKDLSGKDLKALTRAIGEVAQGNFSVRLDSAAKSMTVGSESKLTEFAEALNDIAAGIQNAAFEFNELTDVPCLRFCYVGTDSFLEGRLCGEVMARAIGGKGEVAISTGKIVAPNLELRRKGFISLLREKYPGIEVVDIHENREDPDVAYEQTRALLKKLPRLSGIYASEAPSPPGVARAVQEAGKGRIVKIVSHDTLNATMEYVASGVITATVDQDPFAQGHDPVIHLFNHIVAGWKPPTPRMLTHMQVVNGSNYAKFWDPQKGLIRTSDDERRLAKPFEEMPAKPVRIVFLGRGDSEFWLPVKAGALAAAEKLRLFNTTVEWRVPEETRMRKDFSAAVFGPEIESLVAEKVDGIILFCGDVELVKTINRAVASGVPVATSNGEPFNLRSLLFTISDQAGKLMDLSRSLAASAAEASAATSQISATIETIADGTNAQNEQFQSTKKALESLLANINQINWEAARSVEAADSTVEAISASNQAMDKSLISIKSIENSSADTWKTVQELSAKSERINTAVQMIDDIASKVNVLALNATIEATRAGEAGRGFMVVSHEVRSLAKSTAETTGEIAQSVAEIQLGIGGVQNAMRQEMEKMQTSTSVTDEAKRTLASILSVLGENQRRMRTIASSISEVQNFSKQVNEAMKKALQVSSRNTQSIKEINTATEGLNVQFQDVATLAKVLETISQGEQELLAKFTLAESKN